MTLDDARAPFQQARRGLDRRGGDERVAPELLSQLLAQASTRVIELFDGQSALAGGALARRSPSDEDQAAERDSREGAATDVFIFLGRDHDNTAYVARLREQVLQDPSELHGLRAALNLLGEVDASIFTTSVALFNWHRGHRHCPRCGAMTLASHGGWVRDCTADGSEHYPRTDPAIIVAVLDPHDRILLGHNRAWAQGRFSTLAGFVEPGESLEDAVRREVAEESGIVVGEVTYLGSQPWPFPASLMLGCVARALTSQITVDDEEVTEAHWFSRADLTTAVRSGQVVPPGNRSIAGRLVEYWLGEPLPPGPASW